MNFLHLLSFSWMIVVSSGVPRCMYVRDGFTTRRCWKYECHCSEMLVTGVSDRRQNFYLFGLYRNPNFDGHIFDCILASVAKVQLADAKASFVFMGDLNCHDRE